MILFTFAANHWDDIKSNLIASLITFPIELLATLLIVDRTVKYLEDRKWRPARRSIVLQVGQAHCQIFTTTQRIVDPCAHVDLKPFPPGMTQKQADIMERNASAKWLKTLLSDLERTIQVHSFVLDPKTLTTISSFLLAAQDVVLAANVVSHLFALPSENNDDLPSPERALKIMEEQFTELMQRFSSAETIVRSEFPDGILSAHDLMGIFKKASKVNPLLKIIPAHSAPT